jgi:hypothetical protein
MRMSNNMMRAAAHLKSRLWIGRFIWCRGWRARALVMVARRRVDSLGTGERVRLKMGLYTCTTWI